MSVEALAVVLHHSRAKGTAKVILFGIANHDGDGGAWPSIDTLGAYSNANRATVQRAIARLEALGEITRRVQGGGDRDTADHDRPNRYDVLVKCPPTCDNTTRHRLTCMTCGKRLIAVHRYLLTHPFCAPYRGGRVFDDTPTVERPVEGAASSKTRPELKQPPERLISSSKVLNREAEIASGSQSKIDAYGDDLNTASATATAPPAAGACPKRVSGAPHAYSASSGRCIDCYAINPAHETRTDGEA